MTNCPPSLRGDLSKWLCEINTGVYVGNVSSRVRDAIWDRVCENLKNGQATLVFNTNNEQRMDFRTHNTSWEAVDFEGIKLMRRPLPRTQAPAADLKPGFSNAAKRQMAQKMARKKAAAPAKEESYTVIDLETTGLNAASDAIMEYGALRVRDGQPAEEFSTLVRGAEPLPDVVAKLTGITPEERSGGMEPLAASTGHVAAHEAGAIEFTGHKVIGLPHTNGKLDAGTVEDWCRTFYADGNVDHLVFPGMVYISHPSEYGTLYTKAELEALSAVCHKYHMPLFMDGARLGYGLAAEGTDVTLADVARLTDVFYIGGTKVGALCGEAVVFPHGAPAHFMTMVKQQGALLAKGRLLGIQFDVLFTDDLYQTISKNAIETAAVLKKGLAEKGYSFFMDSPTNQVFIVLSNEQLAALEGKAKFGFWEKYDDTHTVVRIATSWATRMEEVEQLLELM